MAGIPSTLAALESRSSRFQLESSRDRASLASNPDRGKGMGETVRIIMILEHIFFGQAVARCSNLTALTAVLWHWQLVVEVRGKV